MLRALSLCTCRRHYPGAPAGRSFRPSYPAVSAFDEPAIGSACTSSFSRIAQRSLTLRPVHSHRHLRDSFPEASDISLPPCLLRLLPAGAFAGWVSHPLDSAAFSRRTRMAVSRVGYLEVSSAPNVAVQFAVAGSRKPTFRRRADRLRLGESRHSLAPYRRPLRRVERHLVSCVRRLALSKPPQFSRASASVQIAT